MTHEFDLQNGHIGLLVSKCVFQSIPQTGLLENE